MPHNPFFRSPADEGGSDYPSNYALSDQMFVCRRCNRVNEKGDRCAWCGAPRPRENDPRRETAGVYAPPEYMMRLRRPRGPETPDDARPESSAPRDVPGRVYAPPELMGIRIRRDAAPLYAPPELMGGRDDRDQKVTDPSEMSAPLYAPPELMGGRDDGGLGGPDPSVTYSPLYAPPELLGDDVDPDPDGSAAPDFPVSIIYAPPEIMFPD